VNVDAPSGANGAFGNATSSISMGTTYDGGHLTSTMLTTNAVTIGRSITLASTHVNRAGDPHIYTIGGETAQVSNYIGTIFNSNNSGTKAASKLTVTAASGGRVNIANIVRGTGAVGDADDVVKTGAGIVAITGVNNDWQGNTLVQSGAFLVNGSVLTSPSGKNVQVSAGATLGGMGTLSRDVELASTAVLSPGDMDASGNSLGGTLTLGDGIGLSLSAGTLLNFDLAAAGSLLDDEISIIGDLVLAGLLNVNDLGGFGTGEYKLFSWTGSLTYTPGDLTFGDMPSGYDYAIDTTTYANSAYLVVTPEPSRMILLLAGLGLIGLSRRRKV
ncbi:MAG: PEP-CTERM sorting domain-containing protein, partial [Prosthecobacter sp.]|nr:PEP-CTERM sorting domain-containing protein [Prosthecobacter sp.]